MNDSQKCAVCGGGNLEAGTLLDKSGLRFIPADTRFFTMSFGVNISATACMDCGAIALRADPAGIQAMLKAKN